MRAVRVCPGEARALQSAAQRDLRQRATQNCDRQDSEIYFESATACDRSAVSHFRLLSGLNLSTTIPSQRQPNASIGYNFLRDEVRRAIRVRIHRPRL